MREQESSKSKDGDSQDESESEMGNMSHVKNKRRDVYNVRITRGSNVAFSSAGKTKTTWLRGRSIKFLVDCPI